MWLQGLGAWMEGACLGGAAMGEAQAKVVATSPSGLVTLTVGWGNSPPYQFDTPQGPSGLDIELLTLWAQAAGVRLEWVRATWARQLLEASSGGLDLMMSATPSDERRAFADFTAPYREEHLGLIALAGQTLELSRLSDLEGRPVKIGVMRGMAFPPELAQAFAKPALQRLLVPMRGDDLTLAALRSGRLTYIVGDAISLKHHALRDPGEPIAVALRFPPAPVHLLVSRHAMNRVPGLLARLNEALVRVRSSPAWAQVLARYAGA
jgi:polar amino acid transport system substrate-binding protein